MISRMHLGIGQMVALLTLVLSPAVSLANSYDPAAQFSPVINPNGVWSYGVESVLGSPFSLLPGAVPVPSVPGPNIDSWQAPAAGEIAVLHNGTAVAQTVTTFVDSAFYQSNELAMHPGPNKEYAVVQFTAPVAGNYLIRGTFEGIDTTGATNTLVWLLHNNVPLVGGNVIGDFVPSDVPLASPIIFLAAGDTLAFAVGGNPLAGTTALLSGAEVSPDTDGDGIPDASDNCPFIPNGPLLGSCINLSGTTGSETTCTSNAQCAANQYCSLNQEDTGGIGTGSPPDGIGDACQCGDVDNNGIVNNNDATFIRRAVAGIAPYPGGVTTLPGYKKCQVVNGAPGLTCNSNQATIIQRAVAHLAPGILQGCHAATIFP